MNDLYYHALAAVRCAQKHGLDIPPDTIKAIATITQQLEKGTVDGNQITALRNPAP